jgi:V/A-type H+/Na+-transporting ATPase subunit D
MPLRVPPGRMGRLWLRERLAVAGRAADLLEQKRQALRGEAERLGHLAQDTRSRWEETCREAETWLLRAAMVGGERQFGVVEAHLGGASEARIVWRSTMGLAYPWEAECALTPWVDVAGFGETSALRYAIEAHRTALVAAVEHAAAQRAFELVSNELEVTTHRLRAIERRWVPRLEAALDEVEQRLEEREREDVVRARRAAQQRPESVAT